MAFRAGHPRPRAPAHLPTRGARTRRHSSTAARGTLVHNFTITPLFLAFHLNLSIQCAISACALLLPARHPHHSPPDPSLKHRTHRSFLYKKANAAHNGVKTRGCAWALPLRAAPKLYIQLTIRPRPSYRLFIPIILRGGRRAGVLLPRSLAVVFLDLGVLVWYHDKPVKIYAAPRCPLLFWPRLPRWLFFHHVFSLKLLLLRSLLILSTGPLFYSFTAYSRGPFYLSVVSPQPTPPLRPFSPLLSGTFYILFGMLLQRGALYQVPSHSPFSIAFILPLPTALYPLHARLHDPALTHPPPCA
jgi:hypothetical protein